MTPLERLVRQPRRFGFDAAIRLLLVAARDPDPAQVARFRSVPTLAQPPADVLAVGAGANTRPDVTTTVMGLTGAAGVLPRSYTEVLGTSLRNRSPALHGFLDMLSHRLVAHFARAGVKYRQHLTAEAAGLTSGPDPVRGVLLALTGYGTPAMADRLPAGTAPLVFYAGYFSSRPRSADRLQAMVSDWCGRPVEVRQFAGAWLVLPPSERTALAIGRLGGQFDRLGIDAAVGARAWDAQAGIVLRIGPLTREAFEALLPGRPALQQLVSLVRAYLGFETGFAINPVLAADAVPAARLAGAARLGWNTWMPTHGPRRADAAEALFDAETVEALEICK